MEPFFFGDEGTRRFGVFHAADRAPNLGCAVLCYPMGHEYFRAHRAFRNLAVSLSRSGLAALRFDYLGSGDSEGSGTDAGLPQWEADVEAALDEAKRRSGCSRVTLVGLRFGATMAALVARRRRDVETLVLWDPVLNGASYLEELQDVQATWLRDRMGADGERLLTEQPELIGMPVDAELLDQIRGVDLVAHVRQPAGRVVIVTSSPRPDCERWAATLRSQGVDATHAHVPTAGDWLNASAIHQLLLPHEILKHIVRDVVSRLP
jgi:alpha/beta superfamily hydrolase